MTMYKLYIMTKSAPSYSPIEAGLVAVMQAFTRLVVNDQLPEGAECELWEMPRAKWRVVDRWTYHRERWT